MDSRILPEAFAAAYEALYAKTLHDGTLGENHPLNGDSGKLGRADGKATGQWRVNSGHVTTVAKKTGGDKAATKRVGKTARTMRDERLFKYRQRVDKRLRTLARQIVEELEPVRGADLKRAPSLRICAGKCKRLCEVDWNYCPNCGGMTRDMDPE